MGNIDFLLLHFFVAGIGFCLKHESSGKTKVRRQTIEKINIGRHYVIKETRADLDCCGKGTV